jgi:hypothetical protein
MLIPQGVKTPIAADQVPASYTQLMNLIRCRKIKAPAKDSSGDYIWTEADIEAARLALARRRGACVPQAPATSGGGARHAV